MASLLFYFLPSVPILLLPSPPQSASILIQPPFCCRVISCPIKLATQ